MSSSQGRHGVAREKVLAECQAVADGCWFLKKSALLVLLNRTVLVEGLIKHAS